MAIKKLSLVDEPESVTQEEYDCIWIWFSERRSPSPLVSHALQWIDWKMRGTLSKYILAPEERSSKTTTFIPTMHKIRSPYLALESGRSTDWEAFSANCEGLKLKTILCVAESEDRMATLEKELRQRMGKFPHTIVVGTEETADS